MTDQTNQSAPTLTLSLPSDPYLYDGKPTVIDLSGGLTVLVGPNAAGKTSVLKRLRDALRCHTSTAGKHVIYLAAGRSSALENFRSGAVSPGVGDASPAALGHSGWMNQWWQIEGAPGLFMRLKERADLLLKVEARLQTLQQRRVRLEWHQNGLQIKFSSTTGGQIYFANTEASGLLQLIPLLAAVYDDQISALIIDEPEISLHPQLQDFLLQELKRAADTSASVSNKKIIIVATHSPSMLPLRRLSDVASLVFFRDRRTLPVQVNKNAGELKNRKLGALISRLSENHKLAFFAQNVLLVEGPTDEIIVSGLSQTLDRQLLSANTQIVPVTGKGEFAETIKLFRLMGKKVFVMADLDALADSNAVPLEFRTEAAAALIKLGHSDLSALDRDLRNELGRLIASDWGSIQANAETHRYWTKKRNDIAVEGARTRAALAVLLSAPETDICEFKNGQEWLALRQRYQAMLEALDGAGCVFLRRGTIEDYFSSTEGEQSTYKPEMAAIQVDGFMRRKPSEIESSFDDPVRALTVAAPIVEVNENDLLREQLGSLLGAAFQIVEAGMSDDELNARATSNSASEQPVFCFSNKTVAGGLKRVQVSMRSPIFSRSTFPFEVTESNQGSTIKERLP